MNQSEKLYKPSKIEITGYEWSDRFKYPNDQIAVNQEVFNTYWYFIAERMNIYHMRVILEKPAPWTEDFILQQYRFTNVVRDIDALTLYERKHILSKLDDPDVTDQELRRKSVLLNILIYRLWVKPSTYEIHGFIDLADPNWKEKWNIARAEILDRREKGITIFTASYYVCGFQGMNPDKSTRTNKTLNACYMIEYWMDHIDEIYDRAIVQCKNMDEQIDYFSSLPYIGRFNAYELACSIAITSRYCKHPLVDWTQDNSTNVGPGASRGLKFMFSNYGGLTEYELILYLRSIWKHELQVRGTYDQFVSQLPTEMYKDIDLRVIEHCLCELQKYWKAKTNLGRPKETFKARHDISDLK